MAVTRTNELAQSLAEVIAAQYELSVPGQYIYSQPPLAYIPDGGVIAGAGSGFSSLRIVSYNKLTPSNTARSEVTDIAPVLVRDSGVTITPSLFGNAVQLSYAVQHRASLDTFRAASELVAENAGQSIDFIARSAAVGGSGVAYGNGSSRDVISSAGQLTAALLNTAGVFLQNAPKLFGGGMGAGAGYAAIMRNTVIADLAEDATIILVGQYRDRAPETVLRGEVGAMISGVKLIESNHAKVFHGAGSSVAATTAALAVAAIAGQTTISVNTTASSQANTYQTLGVRESTANGEQTNVETVLISSGAGTVNIGVVGGAPNGGLVYDYSSGTELSHYRQVHAVVVFGGQALMKVYASDLGPNGKVFPPENDGLLHQFDSLSWAFFGQFGRRSENRLFRLDIGAERQILGI